MPPPPFILHGMGLFPIYVWLSSGSSSSNSHDLLVPHRLWVETGIMFVTRALIPVSIPNTVICCYLPFFFFAERAYISPDSNHMSWCLKTQSIVSSTMEQTNMWLVLSWHLCWVFAPSIRSFLAVIAGPDLKIIHYYNYMFVYSLIIKYYLSQLIITALTKSLNKKLDCFLWNQIQLV